MVRSMWLFKHKFHADGTLSRYKARLVANGSSQQLGLDFDKTFSSVVKPATIHTVLSLTVSRKWPIHQLDVKNAFLNGDLSETVCMCQPPSFVDARFPNHVCHLQRSLYGLKQAPRVWFQHFAGYATRAGFYHSRLFLSQRKYALQLLERAHMVNCNPYRTPVDTESKLGPDSVPVQDHTLYQSIARELQYLMFTRPDLSYAHTLSRSSAEAEYRGVANVVAESAWLCNLLRELHSPLSRANLVYCDSVSAVYMSANPVQHQRIKHIEIDIYFVQDMVTAS
ncbi:ribonuclease H-like domain-containing protein [Tanacetum coccineum]